MARPTATVLALLLVPACAQAPAARCPEPAAKAPSSQASTPIAPKTSGSAEAEAAPPSDGSRFRLALRVKPVVDPTPLVEVEITARGPASDLDVWTIAAPAKGSLRAVTARDLDGAIPVKVIEDAAKGAQGSAPPVHLELARPPLGSLRLAYSVAAKPISASNAPAVEVDPDRFRALGQALIATPDGAEEGDIAVSLTIDSSDLGETIRSASSLGIGPSRDGKMSARELGDALLIAGHMGTAVFKATEGHDEAAWVGYTTFDPRPIAADVASFRTAVGVIFHEPLPELATLLISGDGRPPGSFVAARRAGGVVVQVSVGDAWTGPVRIAVAAEIIKAWIGERLWIGPTDRARDAEALWFTEGVTRHLARDLLFRFGLISTSELLDEVNGLESVLALSPLKAETNEALAKRIGEPGVLPLLVARGALYATRVDALLRSAAKKKKKGERDEKGGEINKETEKKRLQEITSLETLLRALYEKAREQRGPLPTSAWTAALAKELDQAEADAFGAVIEKGKETRAPDDALGPCFKGEARRYEPFDLGFDREATRASAADDGSETVAGVRAGGPAAKAGLRDGDKLVDSRITNGRSDVPVVLTVERPDGKNVKKTITYRPAGPAVNGRGWSRQKSVPDEQCTQ